ncbi:MAG: hypothetical protein PHP45_08945 [Elusimicrobiales bacterium]|nr:hypothetical protein [Elusimicrobiales bacterium]
MPVKTAAFVFAAAMLALAGYVSRLSPRPDYPQADAIKSTAESGLEDASLLSMGFRRLAADVNFIRLLQYYAQPEEPSGGRLRQEGKDGKQAKVFSEYYVYGLAEAPDNDHFEGGVYAELKTRAMHLLSLDPYFSYAALYAAGALAFNVNRPAEALDVLFYAKQYRPAEWKYDSYIAAIGYSKAGDPARVADVLDKAVSSPDCPAMLKQQAAFFNKKIGRNRRAYEIYEDIYLHSKDEFYVRNAARQMALLKGKPDTFAVTK